MIDLLRSAARLIEGSQRLLAASIAIALAQAAMLVPIALLVRHAFNEQIPAEDGAGLILTGIGIAALYLASGALGLWARHLSLRTTIRAVTKLRGDLLARLYALPRSYFDRADLGTIHGVVVQDTDRLEMMTNALITVVIPSVLISVALTGALLVLDPLLFASLALVAPILAFLSAWLGGAVRRHTHAWHAQSDIFTSGTLQALRAITVTKLHAADQLELDRHRRQHAQLGESRRRLVWMQSAFTLVNGAVGAITSVVVLIVGGLGVANGSMTVGDLIAFFAALGLLRGQGMQILAGAPVVLAGLESLPRVEAILDADAEEPYHGSRRIDLRGELALEHVSFGYGSREVLHDVSIEVRVGERVALVGPNGAGKTTIVSLLLGLYRPGAGRVLIDGTPLDHLDLHSLRSRIGVVPQDAFLLPGTIAGNVAYGRAAVDEAAIRRACADAGADAFIETMAHGYQSKVGDEGVLLSGGQRQKIAIARALAGDPAVLILDEPTTYLDRESAGRLFETVADGGRRTLLIVSHDELLVSKVDRVYELRDGRVVTEHLGDRAAIAARSPDPSS